MILQDDFWLYKSSLDHGSLGSLEAVNHGSQRAQVKLCGNTQGVISVEMSPPRNICIKYNYLSIDLSIYLSIYLSIDNFYLHYIYITFIIITCTSHFHPFLFTSHTRATEDDCPVTGVQWMRCDPSRPAATCNLPLVCLKMCCPKIYHSRHFVYIQMHIQIRPFHLGYPVIAVPSAQFIDFNTLSG